MLNHLIKMRVLERVTELFCIYVFPGAPQTSLFISTVWVLFMGYCVTTTSRRRNSFLSTKFPFTMMAGGFTPTANAAGADVSDYKD